MKLQTSDECVIFAKNAIERGRPDLALAAKKRSIEIRAMKYGAASEVEKECVQAVFAFEETLALKNGRKQRASRTWPMLKKYGIVPAVERVVNREDAALGYSGLVKIGLQDYAFESVVLRHESAFSPECVQRSRDRIASESAT